MQVTTIGVDLAKNVFQVHGIAEKDDVLFNKPLRRAQFLPYFAKLEPCLIGMESCSSAHHWARELTALGHEVRLIPPMYVKSYVKRGKSDAIDAEAICEAVTRPTMRFVAIKTVGETSPAIASSGSRPFGSSKDAADQRPTWPGCRVWRLHSKRASPGDWLPREHYAR